MAMIKKERPQSKNLSPQNNRSESEAREKLKNVKNLKPVMDKKEAEEIGKKVVLPLVKVVVKSATSNKPAGGFWRQRARTD
jgi:hypothetical protein